MRLSALAFCVAPLATLALTAGCDGDGKFDGGVGDDAGFEDPGPTAADIGLPCSYVSPNDGTCGDNPTNQCEDGLECFVVDRDGCYQPGLQFPVWEDQFTSFPDAFTESGFCTLIGDTSPAGAPQCPALTELKVFAPGVTTCLKSCAEPGECGRGDYTCDFRFIDTPNSHCVRRCTLDYPDCVRSGVLFNEQAGSFFSALSLEDFAGGSQCNLETGQCEFVQQRGIAGLGEPCTRSEQCAEGGICLQGQLLSFFNDLVRPDDPGFCAFPCQPRPDVPGNEASCAHVSPQGVFCQDVGALNLGMAPGPVLVDTAGNVAQVGGFCFHQCELAVESSCDSFQGTGCGSLDEQVVGGAWNTVAMCLPDAIRQ